MNFKEYASRNWEGIGQSSLCLRDYRSSHSYPYDPDDWCRCIQVLRMMFGDDDEKKREHILYVAKAINSKQWENIGNNYYRLMYIFQSEWENDRAPKTYHFMQKLIDCK